MRIKVYVYSRTTVGQIGLREMINAWVSEVESSSGSWLVGFLICGVLYLRVWWGLIWQLFSWQGFYFLKHMFFVQWFSSCCCNWLRAVEGGVDLGVNWLDMKCLHQPFNSMLSWLAVCHCGFTIVLHGHICSRRWTSGLYRSDTTTP